MKKLTALFLPTLALAVTACGGNGPTEPAATTATINGVRVISASTYQFGFTPLNGTQIAQGVTLAGVQVSNLSAGQATASVCGQVQTQDNITAAVSLDSTGSMSDNDPGKLRNAAAKAFIDRMTSADKAAILSFDSATRASQGLRASYLWQGLTSDKTLLRKGIDNATFESGRTPLLDAMLDASTLLKASGGTNLRALVLTDGIDNESTTTAGGVVDTALKSGTPLYIIGLDATNTLDFTGAEDIATRTGGLFQRATNASQLEGFFDNMYNAFRAQGCVQLNFTTKPATGTTVTGTLNMTVTASGKKESVISTPFSLQVR